MSLPSPLNEVAELLCAQGLRIGEGAFFFEVDCPEPAQICVELGPGYSNRGRFIFKADSTDQSRLALDAADGFPRYYFNASACAAEVISWMGARGLLPAALHPLGPGPGQDGH